MSRIRTLLSLAVLMLATQTAFCAQGVQATVYMNVDFLCVNGVTTPGYSVYVVGGRPEVGNWDVSKAVKLDPTAYPKWTGTVRLAGGMPGDVLEWKCIIRSETNPTDVQKWQPDPNSVVMMRWSPTPQSVGGF